MPSSERLWGFFFGGSRNGREYPWVSIRAGILRDGALHPARPAERTMPAVRTLASLLNAGQEIVWWGVVGGSIEEFCSRHSWGAGTSSRTTSSASSSLSSFATAAGNPEKKLENRSSKSSTACDSRCASRFAGCASWNRLRWRTVELQISARRRVEGFSAWSAVALATKRAPMSGRE